MSDADNADKPVDVGTSTAASGPAGAHFEGQVGAFYLLGMICGTPARGLPGMVIDRVALQRANEGNPLDDVVVYAHDQAGNDALLEIQVKRSITFAPSDAVFKKVVGQIAKAAKSEGFFDKRYELAIAVAKSTTRIDGPYQDALTMARQIGDAATFHARLNLYGAGNPEMRTFVETFRAHLREEGVPDDDETIWKLLKKLQILPFDFVAEGSIATELARERAALALHSDDAGRANALWSTLIEQSIDIAKSGGDRNRESLLASLQPHNFRFAAERRNAAARATLAESSRFALEDIENRVASVTLSRHERTHAIHTALNANRHVEIRGEAGVGKSGILRLLAEELAIESNVVVINPIRCTSGGWAGLHSQIGYDGTLHDLFVDLANDGGGVLFIDNLDFYAEDKKPLVRDLVSEASRVDGISIITTCRPEFGTEEPSWLPSDAVNRLGQTVRIDVGDLTKLEIAELKASDARLESLLANNHEARQVVRNLFRLARLASQPTTDPIPLTEVDMAERWWSDADGRRDSGWRERSRLLLKAAEQALDGSNIIDVSDSAATPIDALIQSGTFRDAGPNHVVFRHDVFRDWGIANAIHANLALINKLPLTKVAPVAYVRGIELAARMAIERGADGSSWKAFVERLSVAGAHLSWRRAAILGLVRSEAAEILLKRAESVLLEDNGAILREAIRTVGAVETMPASKAFEGIDLPPEVVSTMSKAGLVVPRGPAWATLTIWLLANGDRIPAGAIHDVVGLYMTFSCGTFGQADVTEFMIRQVYGWIKQSKNAALLSALEREERQSAQSDLRTFFTMFAKSAPDLAAEYLTSVSNDERNDQEVRDIFRLRGSLAVAAPKELAQLTAAALIEKPDSLANAYSREQDAFAFIDSDFIPPSPARGPFFDILVNSPKDGLDLIRQLVDHAVRHKSGGRAPGDNVLVVGSRSFPWQETYAWSRSSEFYALTSALMALEAWAHGRVDAGESLEIVLDDVLGPPGSPAAYLQIAVDLLLSHWPKSKSAAVEFLACPELLCLDHERQLHDQLGVNEFALTGAMNPEPAGSATLSDLKKRMSRRIGLLDLVSNYAMSGFGDDRSRLLESLQQAADRLGPYGETSTRSDPAFSVRYAINLATPENWTRVEVKRDDGQVVSAFRYQSPPDEERHFFALQKEAEDRAYQSSIQTSIRLAIDDPSKLDAEARLAAADWARKIDKSKHGGPDEDHYSPEMRDEAVTAVAMIVFRDGDNAFLDNFGSWAQVELESVLKAAYDDPVLETRAGLNFNPMAIAYAGVCHSLAHSLSEEKIRLLLETTSAGHHAVAHGFGAGAGALTAADPRLVRSILRCALQACVIPKRSWSTPDHEIEAQRERRQSEARISVEAELAWLNNNGPEPQWPDFPMAEVHRRRRIRLPNGVPEVEEAQSDAEETTRRVNYHSAATWLLQLGRFEEDTVRPIAKELTNRYMPWTAKANGLGLDAFDEIDSAPLEWNIAFFGLVAQSAIGVSSAKVLSDVVALITALPDRHFFDVQATYLRAVDGHYFNEGELSEDVAVAIRSALAERMMQSQGWSRLIRTREFSIERHIASAIAVLFFNDHNWISRTNCYLYEKGMDRVDPFIPLLQKIVTAAPCPFLAELLMNLVKVSPRANHAELLVAAGEAWIAAYPDYRLFWFDHRFGGRWCELIEKIDAQQPELISDHGTLRARISGIVAKLISLGIPEASSLEDSIHR